jgi:hypothetical protein
VRRVDGAATYGVGDGGGPTTAEEYTFIGYPLGDKARFWCWRVQAKLVRKSMQTNAHRQGAATRSAAGSTASEISGIIRAGWRVILEWSRGKIPSVG